ncbi:putative 26S proteasome regulatory subunit [Ascosphaera acerosa]|nr:putative 26S proteasome regulatory subunit [Ascosphaera acerosa]
MTTSLLTFDGFPRTDIDVATSQFYTTFRTTRARIIHRRNDYKSLMDVLEKKMHEHFAAAKAGEAEKTEAATTDAPKTGTSTSTSTTTATTTAVTATTPAGTTLSSTGSGTTTGDGGGGGGCGCE